MTSPEGPTPRGILKLALPAIAVLVLFGGVAAWTYLFDDFDLSGTLTIRSDRCGSDGFSDIRDGAQVQVTDDANKVLAVGRLRQTDTCEFAFTVPDVPPGEDLYGVKVGNAFRGSVWGTEDQARAGVTLRLPG